MCLVVSGELMPVQDAASLQKAQWVSVGLYMLWLEESQFTQDVIGLWAINE
jgi:hypothetical protein